jgi:hypothetical protein
VVDPRTYNQKMYLKEIELRAQNLLAILVNIFLLGGGGEGGGGLVYGHLIRKTIFTLIIKKIFI